MKTPALEEGVERLSFEELMKNLSFSYDGEMARLAHPDRVEDQDVTMLNLKKQQYVKDPRVAIKEKVEGQLMIMETIQKHIRKEFVQKRRGSSSEGLLVTEKVPAKKKYLVVHFSHYFVFKGKHFPAEFALAEFSIFNGLGNGVSGRIDMGKVPLGFDGDVRERMKETCNPHPPFYDDFDPYEDALKLIEDFCLRHFNEDEEILLFTPKEYIPIVSDGFEWLFYALKERKLEGRPLDYCLLPFSCLLQALINEAQYPENRSDDDAEYYVVHHESLLDGAVHDMTYAYAPELACDYHSMEGNEVGVPHCSENIVKRLIYNACRVLTPFWKVKGEGSLHYPRYLQTLPKTFTSKASGFKVCEVHRVGRYSNVPRFSCSDTMSERLGWSSGSSSLGSTTELSGSSLTLSVDRDDGMIQMKEHEKVPLSDWEDDKLKKSIRVERDFKYGHSLEELASDSASVTSVPLPPNYCKSRPTLEEALLQYMHTPPVKPVIPIGRGRGHRLAAKYTKALSNLNAGLPAHAGAAAAPLGVNAGQFEDSELQAARISLQNLQPGRASTSPSTELSVPSDSASAESASSDVDVVDPGIPVETRSCLSSDTVVSDSLSDSSPVGRYSKWGRTLRKMPSPHSVASGDDSGSVAGFPIGGDTGSEDEQADFDSITVVAHRHSLGL